MPVVFPALALIVAYAISRWLTPRIARFAVARQLLDQPDARRVHQTPIPRLGGVAVFLAVALTLAPLLALGLMSGDDERLILGLVAGTAIMFVIGLVDDLRGVSPIVKVIGQSVAALVVIWSGILPDRLYLAYGTTIELGWLAAPIFLLWVLAVTNAYNLIDGLNGLATGIAIVACVGLAVIAFAHDRMTIVAALAVLAGALSGFLPLNFPIARIFLGDSGSMSIGFLLAVLSARAASRPDGALVVTVPIFAMMVPFLDTALAITRRWLRSERLSGADSRHIHHRLLALGLSTSRATVALWSLAAVMLAFGLVISLATPGVAWLVSVAGGIGFVVLAVYGTSFLSYHELAVAGHVLLTAPRRAKRLIGDQIGALDLSHAIARADNITAVERALAHGATHFGFLCLSLYEDKDAWQHASLSEGEAAGHRAWKLDYPVRAEHCAPYTLSIWCAIGGATRPYGAERVAITLVPSLERWLATHLAASETKSIRVVAQTPAPGTTRVKRSSPGTGTQLPAFPGD